MQPGQTEIEPNSSNNSSDNIQKTIEPNGQLHNIRKLLIYFFFYQGGKDIAFLLTILFLGFALPYYIFNSLETWKKEIPGQMIHLQFEHPISNKSYEMDKFMIDPHFSSSTKGGESLNEVLFFFSGFLPFLIVFLCLLSLLYISRNIEKRFKWRWIWPEFISFTYVYICGFCICYGTTNMLKYLASSPRPDFYDRCLVTIDDNLITCSILMDDSALNQAWKSFPSGHTAYTAYAMTVTTYFLWGKLSLLQPLHLEYKNTFWNFEIFYIVCLTFPWAISAYVAISRVLDFVHFPTDIVAGFFVGYVCGRYSYFCHYPYNSPFCYRMLNVPSVQKYIDKYSYLKTCVFPILNLVKSHNFICGGEKVGVETEEEQKEIDDDNIYEKSEIYQESNQRYKD